MVRAIALRRLVILLLCCPVMISGAVACEEPYNISTFGEDSEGELYVAAHRSGIVLKIVAAGDTAEEDRLPQ